MTDPSDYARAYARDVRVDPTIGGFDNVQDALAGGAGNAVLGNNTTDVVSADVSTPLTADGAPHAVGCLIAAPPAWMDNAGNIIAAGLYSVTTQVLATAGPTTPGLYVEVQSTFESYDWAPLDALGASDRAVYGDIAALAVADVPFGVESTVTMPTDVTAAVAVQLTVAQLAS